MVDESNAIGTTILRTRVLDDHQGEELRALLRQYVDARLELVDAGADRRLIDDSVRTSSRLEESIWSRVAASGRADPHAVTIGLLIQFNERDDRCCREAPVRARKPGATHGVPRRPSGVGGRDGLDWIHVRAFGTRLAFGMLVMPLLLASVIALVFDIAHPRLGIVRVHHQSLLRLKETL